MTAQPNEFQTPYITPTESDASTVSLHTALDLNNWCKGTDLSRLYPELRQMVSESVAREQRIREPIRSQLLPQFRAGSRPGLPASAGIYRITPDEVQRVHCGLLFNGGTECCDGNVIGHSSLALSIYQIGMALVRYQGDCGTWVHQFFRRDLYAQSQDPLQEMLELLRKRRNQEPENADMPRDPFTRLMRRTLMEWAERAVLIRQSKALWRMGHGNPIAYNLLLPTTETMTKDSMAILRELTAYRRFVYVASEPSDQLLLTVGNALYPLEFVVADTLGTTFNDVHLERLIGGQWGKQEIVKEIRQTVRDIRSEIVVGVYRATEHSPARVFYAHKDFACQAAALAIADSVLQPYRGFPMLIDLADTLCGTCFDKSTLTGVVHDAYAAAGEPTRYLGERETR